MPYQFHKNLSGNENIKALLKRRRPQAADSCGMDERLQNFISKTWITVAYGWFQSNLLYLRLVTSQLNN